MVNALAVPGIRVNGQTISVFPNSVKIKQGLGETIVRSLSAGGNSSQTVHTADAEARVGEVSFELPNTVENLRAIAGWKLNVGGNEIAGIETFATDTASFTLKTASLCNDPEHDLTADGVFSVEWKGDAIVLG